MDAAPVRRLACVGSLARPARTIARVAFHTRLVVTFSRSRPRSKHRCEQASRFANENLSTLYASSADGVLSDIWAAVNEVIELRECKVRLVLHACERIIGFDAGGRARSCRCAARTCRRHLSSRHRIRTGGARNIDFDD